MSAVGEFLRLSGVPETDGVHAYLQKVLRDGNLESGWLIHTKEGRWCDEHLMMGAMSELEFRFGTLVATPNVVQLVKQATIARNPDRKQGFIESIKDRIEKHFTDQENACFIVPITVENHWGVIIARVREGNGIVSWGDGLNWKQTFSPYIATVYDVMSSMARFKKYDWSCSSENLMTKKIGFENQDDDYSCGFYVISTVTNLLAINTGCISGYGYKPKYDASITEQLRRTCVKAFFKRVEEAYVVYLQHVPDGTAKEKQRYVKRFGDYDVQRYIQVHKYGYVAQSSIEEIMQRHVTWNSASIDECISIEDPEKYLEELRSEGEVFKYPRTTTKMDTKGSKVTIRYRCLCYRRENPCKATLAIYRIDDGTTVQFKAKKFNTHNHQITKVNTKN